MEIGITWKIVVSTFENRLLRWLLRRSINKRISVSSSGKTSSLVDLTTTLLDELEVVDNDEY